MRAPVADTLVLLGLSEEGRAVVRRDVGASKQSSEVWVVDINGVQAPGRINTTADLRGFIPVGWSQSRLLLGRRPEAQSSELATLSVTGEVKRQALDKELFWTAISPDGQRVAFGTAFRAPSAPLAVWVLENAINNLNK